MSGQFTIIPIYGAGTTLWSVQELREDKVPRRWCAVASFSDYGDAWRFVERQREGGIARERILRATGR